MSRLMLAGLVLVLLLPAQVAFGQEMKEAGMESIGDAMVGGEYSAVISAGRARIRDAAGLDGEIVGYCQKGSALTVWLPAVGEWLIASCEGVTGYVHESLVSVGSMVPAAGDDGMDDSMMKEDAMVEDSMMEDETVTVALAGGEYAAVVGKGRARIRAGAGMDEEIVGHCAEGWALTVWLPAIDGWLTASCYGSTGFIHESLVTIGDAVIPTISDVAMSADGGMMMKDSV